ncbi:unnamed protein product [Dicrocoelium dendriticum]|nr:unnamed protein product [Dicrocoelium dendriticum]
MKKFTLNPGTDNESNQSGYSSQAASELAHEIELPRITTVNVFFPDLNRHTVLRVIGDAVLWDTKLKLIKAFGGHFPDCYNMGLYLPGGGGKLGKFLEEERLLSEYTGTSSEITLQFVRKTRHVRLNAGHTVFPAEHFSKDMQKRFLRLIERGDYKKVEDILAKGFDPNFHCPKTGETPLTIAVTTSKPHNMISLLISGGAYRDYYSKAGLTPLHKAAKVGNFEAVKSLLDFGQSPNTADITGLSPLYHNVMHDPDTKICHRLLYEHSNVGTTNREGFQEIHQAARLNRVEHINLLLMYGADVNSRCNRPNVPVSKGLHVTSKSTANFTPGDTPLHVAACAGQRAAVMRLLSWGADPTLVNAANQTAMQAAQASGNSDLAEVIRLFRGVSPNGEFAAPFLPTPTFNPRRRMRRPPPKSYITEPTPLIASEVQSANSRSMGTSEADNPPPHPRSTKHTSDVPLIGATVQRTVSMSNLHQHHEGIELRRWGNDALFQSPGIRRYGVCSPFFLQTQASYDPETSPLVEVNATLSRRPKSMVKALNERNQFPRNGLHQGGLDGDLPRHFSGLQRREVPAKRDVSAYDLHNGMLQREESQTDSGISNSSADKKVSPPIDDRTELSIKDSRTHRYESRCLEKPNLTLAQIAARGIRPSLSSYDSREWQLYNGQAQCSNRGNEVTITNGQMPPLVPPRPPLSSASTGPGQRTVILHKISVPPGSIPSFGLSLRTVKNPQMVATYQPSTSRPSLQTATRIVQDMPAYNAGIREGDFVLKINDIDVTRFSHDEVMQCLVGSELDTVRLTVLSPVGHSPATIAPTDRTRSISEKDPPSHTSNHENQSTTMVSKSDEHGQSNAQRVNDRVVSQFARPTPSPDSGVPSSARSSDRTNCSSIRDEGLWSRSTGLSRDSVDSSVSSYGIRSPRILKNSKSPSTPPISSMNRPRSGGKLEERKVGIVNSPNSRGLTRSRTTTGLAEESHSKEEGMAQSLYFARRPRFHRLGSQDSRSSVSSGGQPGTQIIPSTNEGTLTGAIIVERKPAQVPGSNSTHNLDKNDTSPMCKSNPAALKLTVIKAERKHSRQRCVPKITHTVRRYPAIASQTASNAMGPAGDALVNPDLVLLPPAEFR